MSEGRSDAQVESDEAEAERKAIEDDPPKDLEDWPGGKAEYETFGGEATESGYGENARSTSAGATSATTRAAR